MYGVCLFVFVQVGFGIPIANLKYAFLDLLVPFQGVFVLNLTWSVPVFNKHLKPRSLLIVTGKEVNGVKRSPLSNRNCRGFIGTST